MSIILNKKQSYIVDKSYTWYNRFSEQTYEFSGSAGTGKSTVLLAIIDRLNIPLHRVAPMAFIGQAAIVMRLKGLYNAKTIHSWIFHTTRAIKRDDLGNSVMNNYFNRPKFDLEFIPKELVDISLIIVDEAGSIPLYLRPHIERHGIKVLATGDLSQLPPVGDKPAYLYNSSNIDELDEIVRQEANSAIIYLADRAKRGLPIHKGFYGNVLVIEESELTNQMILGSDIIICGRNDTVERYNKRVREQLLGIKSDLPIIGERMVCRKNNWQLEVDGINLANGLVGEVVNMPGVHGFKDNMYEMSFRPFMLNSYFERLKCDYKYLISPYNKKDEIKNNKYSQGEKFDFAYAITTHRAQGSQYNKGILIEEFLSKEYHNNLLYTGITRFSNFLILVKQVKKYF